MFADEASKKPLEIVYVTNITEKAPPSRKQQGTHLFLSIFWLDCHIGRGVLRVLINNLNRMEKLRK